VRFWYLSLLFIVKRLLIWVLFAVFDHVVVR